MRIITTLIFLFMPCFAFIPNAYAAKTTLPSITTTQLINFKKYPSNVQALISDALKLSTKRLTYQFGSANPKNGGMDCSGTIYYLLRSSSRQQTKQMVPRRSDQIYQWTKDHGKFYPVKNHNLQSKEFAHLNPGDLLFWTGTYPVKRKSPITHVMLYLGKNMQGKHLIFGSSTGPSYINKKLKGVNVFDFKLPRFNSKVRFVGYSCIPNVTCKRGLFS